MTQFITPSFILLILASSVAIQGAETYQGELSVLPNYCVTFDTYKQIAPTLAKDLATTFKDLDANDPIVCVLFKKTVEQDPKLDEYGNLYVVERLPALEPMAQLMLGGQPSKHKRSLLDCHQKDSIRMFLPLWKKEIQATMTSSTGSNSFDIQLRKAMLMVKDKLSEETQEQIQRELSAFEKEEAEQQKSEEKENNTQA